MPQNLVSFGTVTVTPRQSTVTIPWDAVAGVTILGLWVQPTGGGGNIIQISTYPVKSGSKWNWAIDFQLSGPVTGSVTLSVTALVTDEQVSTIPATAALLEVKNNGKIKVVKPG